MSRSKKIHLRVDPSATACIVGNRWRRWGSQMVTSTRDVGTVTCKRCLKTLRGKRHG